MLANHKLLILWVTSTILSVQAHEFEMSTPIVSDTTFSVVSRQLDQCTFGQLGDTFYGASASDYYGSGISLSHDGKILAIGSRESSVAAVVYDYDNVNDAWVPKGQVINGETSNDWGGLPVKLSADGNILALAAVKGGLNNEGEVRIYRYDNINDMWNKLGANIVGIENNSAFGVGLELSDDGYTFVAGQWWQKAHAFHYNESNDSWERMGDIITHDTNARWGWTNSLSSDGKTWAIGAFLGDVGGLSDSGFFRVYRYDDVDESWDQLGNEVQGDQNGDDFAVALALSGDGNILIVGVRGYNNDDGLVRSYHYDDTSEEWQKHGDDIVEPSGTGARFGFSVVLSRDAKTLSVGAATSSTPYTNAGRVQVFQFNDILMNWDQVGSNIEGLQSGDWNARISMTPDGQKLATGAGQDDQENIGNVRVWDLTACVTVNTNSPTKQPTALPTKAPTNSPTAPPTNGPSKSPTASPTESPTRSLPAEYILPSPLCSVDVTDGTSVGDVTCAFTGIISPGDATLSMNIHDYDCVAEYESTSFGDTDVSATTALVTGATSFDAIARVNPESGHQGEVKFCIRTDLKDATSSDTMIYRSEQIGVTFSYNGDFSVAGFTTTPFVGIGQDATTATKNFGVTASVCDAAGATLTNPPPLSLGTNLFVCLETNVVGTKIPAIVSFTAQKGADTPYNVATPSPNVVIRGMDTPNVKVVMNLPARFFADSTVINLSGSVEVTRDSRRRMTSSRILEIDSEKADFGLDISVSTLDDEESSTSGRTMMMSTAIFGIVALLFI